MLVWYTARGAGLAALVLLTLATAGGAVQSTRRLDPANRVVLQYVHRAAAVAGLAVVALHVTTILLDPYAGVGWVGALVPGASGYRPWQVALGTVALYGFVGVSALGAARRSLARHERGAAWWRSLHLTSYAFWGVAVLHGLTSGTDAGHGWALGLTIACVVAVAAGIGVRLADRRPATLPVRRATAGATS